jgi:hypothetical protein
MGHTRDPIPTKEAEVVDWVDNFAACIAANAVAWDIPGAEVTDLQTAFTTFKTLHVKAVSPERTPIIITQKNAAKAALLAKIRALMGFRLKNPIITDADRITMGLHVKDTTRTVMTVVNDAVDIDSITHGPITGSHVNVIRYHIEGKSIRAKVPYHLAVIQVYIRGADDPEPILNNERGWSKDFISMNEPFEMRHNPEDAGKMAYYRAHWETSGGVKGPWSMASAEIP